MNITNIIIIVVLILVILWVINRIFFSTNIIYDIMCDANKKGEKNEILNSEFPENNTFNFTLSLWFYIDSWNNQLAEEKNIIYIASNPTAKTHENLKDQSVGISKKVECGSMDGFKNLGVTLDQYENNLFIDIETIPMDTNDCSGSVFTRYKLKNIPVQKWNNLTISVDTKTLDVYLDGKLRNSFIMHGLYKNKYESVSAKKNLYLGSINKTNMGFEGFITRIRYEASGINPQEAYNIYREGINSSVARSIYNKYKLKVSFLEYNKEKGSFTL